MARTQIDRPFRLKSTLGDDALLLESFEGWERVSTPFRYLIRALSEDADIDMKALLTKALVLTCVLHKGERHIHGNISRIKLMSIGEDGLAAYEIEMVAWLWYLNLFTNCRIFQNKSVPDIIEKIFADRGYTDYKLDLSGSYSPREYCVQYRETDFNFISRLLEDEGIFYYFEQTLDKHTMVLVDQKEKVNACAHQAEARFMPAQGGKLEEDTVQTLEAEFSVSIGSTALTDYDFTKPATNLYSELSSSDGGEYYDYPGAYSTKDDGDRYARVRLEEKEVRIATVRAQTNCMGFECGYKFDLTEHYRTAANQTYMLTALHHVARNSSYRSDADVNAFEYTNDIEAIPASVPFRPPRRARKPLIRGTQPAVVVGKAGEEIWVDQYGRVVVKFFWDREGTGDEKSSCWIRVSQGWAGKKWGAIYTPRIGQEVLVSFLEGDPDRPIITGRVYNADQMPPYTLPDEQTKSTLKSMSSKGGEGFNELRFEDKKGSEQIFLHGEKDLDIKIKNDRMESIGNNRHLTVEKDKYEEIKGDEHSQIVGMRTEKITGDHYLNIGGNEGIKITGNLSRSVTGNVVESVTGNQSLSVTGNLTEKITGNLDTEATQNVYIKGLQVVIEAEMGLTIKMGPNFITLNPAGIAISGVPFVNINSGGSALSGSPGQPGQEVQATAPTAPTASVDDQPGGVTSAPSYSASSQLANLPLSSISPAQRQAEAPDEPDREAPAPSAGGGGSPASVAEVATFPKKVDLVAVAAVMKQAAIDGVPFCEECEKARQQQGASQEAS